MQKNKKYILSIIVIAILIILGIYFLRPVEDISIKNTTDIKYPSSLNYDLYTISEFKVKSLKPGLYDIEGYVVKKYECPPCDDGALCKPCMENNIVISENNTPMDLYRELSDSEAIIFVNQVQQFEVGKKYRFSVKLFESNRTGGTINDIGLVGFDPIQ